MDVGDKGICRLSTVAVRREPSDKAEMVSQLLFGEHYEVLEIAQNEKWLRIKIYFDNYEGWIDYLQHTRISPEYFEQINVSDYKISLDKFSTLLFKKSPLTVVAGSILPISTNELFAMEEQLAFNGESKSLSQKRDFDFLKEQALKFLNTPYLWGGRSPMGIDCSGMVQVLYKMTGHFLPRDSGQQVKFGKKVDSREEVKPGDLAFFSKNGAVDHVGILLDKENIFHASGRVRNDKFDETGIFNSELNRHTHHLHEIRRIFKD